MSNETAISCARVIYTDLDGTLLDAQNRVTDYTRSVLKILRARGNVYLVIATGRSYAGLQAVLRESNIDFDFIVSSNGAEIHDGQGKLIFAHYISPNTVQRLLNMQVDEESGHYDLLQPATAVTKNIYQRDKWYVNYPTSNAQSIYGADFQPICDPALCQRSLTELDGVLTVFFRGSHERLLPIERDLQVRFARDVQHVFSFPHLLEASAPNVNKGVAVTQIARLLNVPLQDTVAFGDGLNDVSMLAVVGTPYVMANTPAHVLDVMDFPFTQIESNVDDGVARQLERLFR